MKILSLVALGLALVGTATWAMSDTHAAALSAASNHAGTILPYGAMGHDANASAAMVLPYGAVTSTHLAPAVTPYGTVSRTTVATTSTVLPYGAMGPHAAP